MTTFKKYSFLLLLFVLAFSACKKDSIIDEEIIINPTPQSFVNASVNGLVLDKDHQPISNANIQVGVHNTTSDENGVFTLKNIQLNKEGALITAEKEGYYYNAKFVRPDLNKMSFTRFKLTGKTLSGSLQASSGGSISTNGNASVTFPANAIKRENGGVYNGNVNVFATWIDPTGADLLLEMPGDLRAINSEDARVQLTTFGMIGVELEDDNGEPLNIADGQTATIEFPVPSALLSSAPATIPLWHFDEVAGMWIEEGEATLEGNKYVGTVSHFSFWNCDVPGDFITLNGSVVNESGGVQNLLVQINNNSNGTSGFAYTNDAGVFSGFVPSGEVLTILLLDNCGDEIYSEQIGPFSEDTTLDPIVLNNNITNTVTIFGNLEDCDMNPVTDGYVRVDLGTAVSIIQVDANGDFDATISTCEATEVILTGTDAANFTLSNPATFPLTGAATLDAGTISTCDIIAEPNEFIITVDGVTLDDFIGGASFAALFSGGETDIFSANDSINTFSLSTIITELNTPLNPISFNLTFTIPTNPYTYIYCSTCSDLFVTFTSADVANPGDVIEGTLEGSVVSIPSGIEYQISGSFRYTQL